MKQNETFLMPKNAEYFVCNLCDFKCSKLSNYNLHLSTRKHKMKQNETTLAPKNAETLCCNNCEKTFNSRKRRITAKFFFCFIYMKQNETFLMPKNYGDIKKRVET